MVFRIAHQSAWSRTPWPTLSNHACPHDCLGAEYSLNSYPLQPRVHEWHARPRDRAMEADAAEVLSVALDVKTLVGASCGNTRQPAVPNRGTCDLLDAFASRSRDCRRNRDHSDDPKTLVPLSRVGPVCS